MENASKALVIAGGMLLAIMIVGLLVWGYTNISKYRQSQVESQAREQISEFNKKFETYNKKTVRGYQMISLANLARDINERYSEDDGYQNVTIIMKMKEGEILAEATTNEKVQETRYRDYYDMGKYVENIYEGLNSNNKNYFKELYFECEDVQYDSLNSRVTRMVFTQVGVKAST